MTLLKRSVCCVLSAVCYVLPAAVYAESRLSQQVFPAGGGQVGSSDPLHAITVIGELANGTMANGSLRIYVGDPLGGHGLPPGTKTITVEGTLDDAAATVVVSARGGSASGGNDVEALVSGTTFRAEGLQIVEGSNTITATATDPVGNSVTTRIVVILHTWPPPRPTVAAAPTLTAANSYTLTGTKTASTSLWINGTQIVPLNDATTWSATVPLVEGDNIFVIVTKDAVGATSASYTVTIVVDNLPPVITVTSPTKTNFTPYLLTGTVDDSLTIVTLSVPGGDSITAGRSGKAFTADIPLSPGPNTFTITATSPNGYVATKTVSVILGAMPTIQTLHPSDGTKLYPQLTTVELSATDPDNDPIEYQWLLDGRVMADWSPAASYQWHPTETDRGVHIVEGRARDGFGGVAAAQSDVLVIRTPVSSQ